MEQSERSRLIRETWRIRCPQGHADIRDKQGPTVYCRSCAQHFQYVDLVDVQEETIGGQA